MRHLLAFLVALLVAMPALASGGSWNVPQIGPGSCSQFTWTSTATSTDQPALIVNNGRGGLLRWSASVTSGAQKPLVFFVMAEADVSNPTGNAAFTVTSTRKTPAGGLLGPGQVLEPAVTLAAQGGSVRVCSLTPGEAPFQPSDLYEFTSSVPAAATNEVADVSDCSAIQVTTLPAGSANVLFELYPSTVTSTPTATMGTFGTVSTTFRWPTSSSKFYVTFNTAPASGTYRVILECIP